MGLLYAYGSRCTHSAQMRQRWFTMHGLACHDGCAIYHSGVIRGHMLCPICPMITLLAP